MQPVRKAVSGGFEQRMAKGPDCDPPPCHPFVFHATIGTLTLSFPHQTL